MFDTDCMEYRLTEDRFNDLCNARHLVSLLSELSNGNPLNARVDLNRESLEVTFEIIGGMMDSALPDLCLNPKMTSSCQEIALKNTQDTNSGANDEKISNNVRGVKS